MKSKSVIRMLAVILVLVLAVPMFISGAQASEKVDPEAAVFVLRFVKDEDEKWISAFGLYDEATNETYLVSVAGSKSYHENGYESYLYGTDGYCEEVTLLGTDSVLAYYSAPGLENFRALVLRDSDDTEGWVTTQTLNEDKSAYIGATGEYVDLSNWERNGGMYLAQNISVTLFYNGGALTACSDEEVFAITAKNNSGNLLATSIVGWEFPTEFAVNVGGDHKTEEAPTEDEDAETEEGSMSLPIIAVVGVILIGIVIIVNRKKPAAQQEVYDSTIPAPDGYDDHFTVPLDNQGGMDFQPDYLADTAKTSSKWQIRSLSGSLCGQTFLLYDTLRIGRSPQCEVSFPQDTRGISGFHCELALDGDRVVLRDMGSTYGTYLGKNVKMESRINYYLQNGDTFTLAENGQSFRLELAGASVQEFTPVVRGLNGETYRADIHSRVTFGRNPSSQVVFDSKDTAISTNHCVLYKEGDKLYLKDTGSTNGTFFDENQRLKPNVPYRVRKGMTFFLTSPRYTFTITEE